MNDLPRVAAWESSDWELNPRLLIAKAKAWYLI